MKVRNGAAFSTIDNDGGGDDNDANKTALMVILAENLYY